MKNEMQDQRTVVSSLKSDGERRINQVRRHFDNTEYYLKNNYNIEIRKQIAWTFLSDTHFRSVIDIACGNAMISNQFLDRIDELILVDQSPRMLNEARKRIPVGGSGKVVLVERDFERDTDPIFSRRYDLVVCTGLLAHTDEPTEVVKKLARLCSDGGLLLLQNTDGSHLYSKVSEWYRKSISLIKDNQYQHSCVRQEIVDDILERYGYMLLHRFRYISSFMFLSGLLCNHIKEKVVRMVFGSAAKPTVQGLGNDVVSLYRKISMGEATNCTEGGRI